MDENNWFTVNNTSEIDTPALLVYPVRVKQNINTLVGMIDDASRLRPHIKTVKSKEPVELMMQAGICKFKCATIAEAEMLAMAHAKDVLLAYQPTGPKLLRFLKLIEKYPLTRFSCLVDNETVAVEISGIAVQKNLEIPVYLDLNVGMYRTGIPTEKAFDLYKFCSGLAGIRITGLHAYDGHIHDASFELRAKRLHSYISNVLALQDQLVQEGFPQPVIVAGGTPTFPILCKMKNIECSPGTFIFWDKGYQDAFAEQSFLPAALVLTRVISLPGETKICLDVGHKSVASENELDKRITFLNAPNLVPVSQSEEHLVLDAGENHNFKVGDVLYGLPYHICPTVALYERAITIENNRANGEWKTIARDRRINV